MHSEDDSNKPMTEDEWWDGLDRELSQILVGMSRAYFAAFLLTVTAAIVGYFIYIS